MLLIRLDAMMHQELSVACLKSYISRKKIVVFNHHLINKLVSNASQVLAIGVTTGSSVFGLFQAKVSAYPRMKWFICMRFIMI